MSLGEEAFDIHLLLAFLVMFIAGILGGLVNRYLAERRFEERWRDVRSIRHYLLFGVVTALTVPPLTLAILSSSLLANARHNPADWYVFAAFCLTMVIATYRIFENFVTASTDRQRLEVLQEEVERIKEAQQALYRYLEPMVAASEKTVPREALTYNDMEILRALADESYVYGNLAALTEKTGLGRELISQRLTILKNAGLIDTRINEGNVLHWVISARGRQTLSQDGEADA
ncbi:MAG: hypothetical protein LBO79_03855 [Zoogloeaceae bacterium]|jgi:DNA-binding transcriptional ArsR family regulator|nr:hypothetical protein [Zoogloeaceae bacterium]